MSDRGIINSIYFYEASSQLALLRADASSELKKLSLSSDIPGFLHGPQPSKLFCTNCQWVRLHFEFWWVKSALSLLFPLTSLRNAWYRENELKIHFNAYHPKTHLDTFCCLKLISSWYIKNNSKINFLTCKMRFKSIPRMIDVSLNFGTFSPDSSVV